MVKKSAFLFGLREGLSAPFALFAPLKKPKQINASEPVQPFPQIKTNIGGIEADWARLGGDMNRAMEYVAARVG
ncbi:MAG: hypothetical protein LBU89_11415 [Fibromonadaceae bacterium]|jgi:hypothetical protein|nr:hypothetical protein [Fibromonadaceae bacterium]